MHERDTCYQLGMNFNRDPILLSATHISRNGGSSLAFHSSPIDTLLFPRRLHHNKYFNNKKNWIKRFCCDEFVFDSITITVITRIRRNRHWKSINSFWNMKESLSVSPNPELNKLRITLVRNSLRRRYFSTRRFLFLLAISVSVRIFSLSFMPSINIHLHNNISDRGWFRFLFWQITMEGLIDIGVRPRW